jgi:hypothetical protein
MVFLLPQRRQCGFYPVQLHPQLRIGRRRPGPRFVGTAGASPHQRGLDFTLQTAALAAQLAQRGSHHRLVGEFGGQRALQSGERRRHRRCGINRLRPSGRLEAPQRRKAVVKRSAIGVEILADVGRAQGAHVGVALAADLRVGDERVRADRCGDDCQIDQQPPR